MKLFCALIILITISDYIKSVHLKRKKTSKCQDASLDFAFNFPLNVGDYDDTSYEAIKGKGVQFNNFLDNTDVMFKHTGRFGLVDKCTESNPDNRDDERLVKFNSISLGDSFFKPIEFRMLNNYNKIQDDFPDLEFMFLLKDSRTNALLRFSLFFSVDDINSKSVSNKLFDLIIKHTAAGKSNTLDLFTGSALTSYLNKDSNLLLYKFMLKEPNSMCDKKWNWLIDYDVFPISKANYDKIKGMIEQKGNVNMSPRPVDMNASVNKIKISKNYPNYENKMPNVYERKLPGYLRTVDDTIDYIYRFHINSLVHRISSENKVIKVQCPVIEDDSGDDDSEDDGTSENSPPPASKAPVAKPKAKPNSKPGPGKAPPGKNASKNTPKAAAVNNTDDGSEDDSEDDGEDDTTSPPPPAGSKENKPAGPKANKPAGPKANNKPNGKGNNPAKAPKNSSKAAPVNNTDDGLEDDSEDDDGEDDPSPPDSPKPANPKANKPNANANANKPATNATEDDSEDDDEEDDDSASANNTSNSPTSNKPNPAANKQVPSGKNKNPPKPKKNKTSEPSNAQNQMNDNKITISNSNVIISNPKIKDSSYNIVFPSGGYPSGLNSDPNVLNNYNSTYGNSTSSDMPKVSKSQKLSISQDGVLQMDETLNIGQ